MLFFLLFLSTAQATEPEEEPIVPLRAGETFRAQRGPYYVLPEAKYDRCLANTKLLNETQEDLDEFREASTQRLTEALEVIEGLEMSLQTCDNQVGALTLENASNSEKIRGLRVQRNIAIGGGLALIAGVVTYGIMSSQQR